MIRIRRILTLLVAAALCIAASGCSPSVQGPAPAASATAAPPAADPAVDGHEPGRVCDAFAAAVYRVDTTLDRGPQDAYWRAAAYMAAPLVAAVAIPHPVPRTPQWQQWAVHRALTDIQVDPYAGDALPPVAGGEQHYAAVVAVWPIGRDGWRGPMRRHTVVCVLRPAEAGWRVSSYEAG